ncbi:MAG: fibrillarin-like rRNA/tRNA 2'-O-methyltransferase [Thermoplasmata archaeon]|nr:fibrillarin-like rRNA/tRNA 2'-O-methyltransferase [Thermoplasmata archaeon]
MKIKNFKNIQNVYQRNNNLLTENLAPGNQVYGENLVKANDVEYRMWNPRRSKLAALLLNGGRIFPFSNKSRVLYLGAASGTTASHLSDIIANGMIYCVEFSQRAFRDLVLVCETRKNMIPILEDAHFPARYKPMIDKVDVVYQDISQRDQVNIILKNLRLCLKDNGYGILMVKARSIDITAAPSSIFQTVKQELKRNNLKVLESINLNPYAKDHMGLVIK